MKKRTWILKICVLFYFLNKSIKKLILFDLKAVGCFFYRYSRRLANETSFKFETSPQLRRAFAHDFSRYKNKIPNAAPQMIIAMGLIFVLSKSSNAAA